MQVKDFIAKLEKMNFSLTVKEGKLILKGDNKKLTKQELEAIRSNKEVIDYIKSHKEELIEYISLVPGVAVAKNAKDIISVYRLSGLQQGMLFHGLYDSAGSYIDQVGCDLVGVNIEVLLASWSAVIERHTILRSAFYYDSFSIPVQCVYRDVVIPVQHLDYSRLDEDARASALKAYEEEDRSRGFDFKTAPLMRLTLIKLEEDRYRMIWTSHHILFDGWSLPILIEEFLNIYELLIAGKPLPQVTEDKYEDYIRYLERRDKIAEEQYWRNYLAGVSHSTLLPFVGTTSERTKGIGQYGSLLLVKDVAGAARIQQFAQSNRITVNTLMQGIWAWLLYKYTGSAEVVYGVVVSGRPAELAGVEHRVGMYINTLALKAKIAPEQNTISWLQGLQADQVASRQYQYIALQDAQAFTGIKGDLFDSLLIFENYPVSKMVESGSWSLRVENVEVAEQTNYPLTVIIGNSEELVIDFNYNTELLDEVYVSEIRDHFELVLQQIIEGSSPTLGDIRILTASQEQRLINDFNNTTAEYPRDKSIVELFEAQAAKSPDAIALSYDDKQLTYAALNERSNQLAHYLQKNGVKAETLVPICIERGFEMIVGILGVLKAGGVYVPIDPDYPQDRISYMLEDTGAKLALSSTATRDKLDTTLTVIAVDGDWEQIAKENNTSPEIVINPEQLAYVIYTSGSTGKPKGVLVEHGGVVNLATSQAKALRLKPGMRTLQFASFGFDASCYEIFNTVLSGGSLVLAAKEDLLSQQKFKELVKKQQVELAVIPPSFQLTLDEETLQIIRTIVSAGEALNETTGRYIQSQGVRLINAYGPTETTVCASLSDDPIKADHTITIGTPIANTQIYILNTENELSPIGVTGEICVGGAGIARGYLNRAELTSERFIKDPFSEDPKARLYKTGDLGRWQQDGNIEYLGRIDDQVKIRGFRIELGEIESVLNQSEQVQQGVVLATEDNYGEKRLVGYVVPSEEFDKQLIQDYLGKRLPEYMIPALWIELETMPLTPSGKIDRKALPDPEDIIAEKGYVAPLNETEAKLAELWQEVLEIEQIGVTDDFFELGGHSLLAIRLISAIRKTFGIELPINDVFDYPTIGSLSTRLIKEMSRDILPPVTAVTPRPEHVPLSFSQERLWFIDKLEGSLQYHLPAVLRLKGEINKDVLENTIRLIITRHEVLRTVILKDNEGRGYQQVVSPDNWNLVFTEAKTTEETGLIEFITGLINRSFDLSNDYMLRADLIKVAQNEHILVVTMHHIASDGWSSSIMVKEVIEIYQSQMEGRQPKLPSLPIQYADYAIWQQQYMQGAVLENKLDYWKKKLDGATALQLPTDYGRPAIQTSNGATLSFNIDKGLSTQLQALSQAYSATLYMSLLAVFKVLLYRYSGQEDITVGTPVAGRNQQELEGLIGFFINTLVLRNHVSGNMQFSTLLKEVKTTTLEAYSHQEVPFEKVVDAVVKTRDMSRSPLFQVLFSLQNTPDVPELKLGELTLSAESQEDTTAKFDLTFLLAETSSGIQGTVEFNTDLYREETIERMISHYLNLLNSVVSLPENLVSRLTMLNAPEEQQLLLGFNATEAAYPKDKSIVDLFEEKAAKHPNAIALESENQEQLNYATLNERSNRLARYLVKKGVVAETLVPICMERSIDMVIAMLGILKAGGAYVPIDPEYPADRISYMLDDTAAKLVLTNSANSKQLDETIQVIRLDEDGKLIESESSENLNIKPLPTGLAYVIYTSGSTGKPKGVMIEHRSLINLTSWHNGFYEVAETSKATSMAGVGFDAFGWEIWPYLSVGASVCIVSDETRLSPSALLTLFTAKEITHSFISTALVPDFIEASRHKTSSLKYLLTGGDKLTGVNLDNIGYTLVNNYGPTENTVVATSCIVLESDKTPPIGEPISNTRIYILNHDLELSPIGASGEIYIGGASLARGYLNRPELTAEKFIQDPFSPDSYRDESGARLYKTGDLGRWRPDGNIEYLGRVDDQVKIRGYRIELGEIESVLNQSEHISQAVVLTKEDSKNNKRLVGYVVAATPFDKQAIQTYLSTKLPEHMVPAIWVELESLPLTANGKIDRKALPDPDITDITVEYVAPGNETEEKLVRIWQELLGVERIGIYDNFFELGGHSLLAMRLVSYIERDLLVTIPIQMLFKFTCINDLSKYLEIQNRGDFQERNTGTFKLLDV